MQQHNTDFFKNGTAHIVSSSHNDIAWWNTPYKTMEYRDLNIISPAIEMVKKDPDFKHTMECVLYLMEYLQRHPEEKETLHRLAIEKRLMWGATYTQPYENLLNDEGLVRQVYLGKKWFDKTFEGAHAKVAWSPDVPGRSMQFPQILKKAGIDYLMISRIDAGAFEWFSPDGSSVKGYSVGHYFTAAKSLESGSVEEVEERLNETLVSARDHYRECHLPPEYIVLSVADYVKPNNYAALISQWPPREERKYDLPDLKHSSIEEFMDAITADPDSRPRVFRGERPNEWAYIHGATHHKEIAPGRRASNILPQTEMYHVICCLLENNMDRYPAKDIENAWKYILYPDHGFGGGNGHITDKVFGNALKRGCEIAESLRGQALKDITRHIAVKPDSTCSIIVFNPTARMRTDVVRYDLDIRDIPSRYFMVADSRGQEIEYQIVDENNAFELTIEFTAENVSGMGYKTYYIQPAEHPAQNVWLKETSLQRDWLVEYENLDVSGKRKLKDREQVVENRFYRLKFGQGGLESLFDKQLHRELLDTSCYKGFEIFMLNSHGTGANEAGCIQMADTSFLDEMKNYDCEWEITEDGTLRTCVCLKSHFSCCHIVQTISVYHTVKKIDCDVEIVSFDGTPYREIRFALPIAMDHADITYDVPMGAVTVGRDEIQGACGTQYFDGITCVQHPTDCREIHPREVQNWIAVHNQDSHIVLSSDVSMFDYKNVKDGCDAAPILQPILLASRRSCHGWGNEYLQMGTHRYHFTMSSGNGNIKNSSRMAEYANQPLIAVKAAAQGCCAAGLPEDMSFFSICNENVAVSSIKKCEDDNSVILRVYENYGDNEIIDIRSCFPVYQAAAADIIENEKQPVEDLHHIEIGCRSIETFKLIMK